MGFEDVVERGGKTGVKKKTKNANGRGKAGEMRRGKGEDRKGREGREKKRTGRAWSPLLDYKSTNRTGTVTD